jgi:hypothetical protein
VKVIQPGDGEGIAALQAQAQVLSARIDKLTGEIETARAEAVAPGAAPTLAQTQLRLTSLESRRIDAEEALQKVEDQLAGIGVRPATVATVGTEAPAEPRIPFDPNEAARRENEAIIFVAAIVCIGAPIAIAFARLLWRRATARPLAPPSAEDAGRLARVEQAVDAMALEVERMSEGQRYVTRLLAERAGAEPATMIELREPVPSARR